MKRLPRRLLGIATNIAFVAFGVLLACGCSTQLSGLGTGNGGTSGMDGSVASGGATGIDGTRGTDGGVASGGVQGGGGASGAGGVGGNDGNTRADGGGQSPVTVASVKVDRAKKAGTIGPGFAGLSYEKSHLNNSFFTPDNAALIGLFKLLGPSVLRIGGNSVDTTTWAPAGKGKTLNVIAPPDVDALAGFLRAANWSVIYAVNMAADDPSAAADEAAYAAKALGAQLYGFEVGNETDLYHSNGDRPTNWTYADYLAQWKTFYSTMQAAAPSAAFTGPAAASNYKVFTVPFANDAAADIVLLTQHYYRGDGKAATSTLAELLQPDPALITMLDALSTASTTNHMARGYRLAEANSFYNGGAPGISDGYGTALWVLDFLFTNALHGSAGVNFHGGGTGTGYTPIADNKSVVVEARPDYYGMFLFTQAGQGDLYATTVTIAGVNFSAYTLGLADGTTSVVLVNKDEVQTVRATVALGKAAASAALTLLTGPSLASTTGFTVGGAAIASDGSWTAAPTPDISVMGTTLVVDVPPASAALLRVQ
jgi:hypothetical protein